MSHPWPWAALALLGAFHGLNPAMGWLFAVALGLQERRRGAVLAALAPITLGHLLSVALVVLALGTLRLLVPFRLVRLAGAAALVGLGLYKLARPFSHPRWVGMRVGFGDLTLWSFLMTSAHGAGLMLVPVLLGLPAGHAHAPPGLAREPPRADLDAVATALAAVGVHTLALVAVMGVVALLIFEIVGVGILRRAWVNLDLIWAVALVAAGVITLFVG